MTCLVLLLLLWLWLRLGLRLRLLLLAQLRRVLLESNVFLKQLRGLLIRRLMLMMTRLSLRIMRFWTLIGGGVSAIDGLQSMMNGLVTTGRLRRC